MDKKLPIYKMSISDDEESTVSYVALVDNPATERNWFAFQSQEFEVGNVVSVVPGKEQNPNHKGLKMTIVEIYNGSIGLQMPNGDLHNLYLKEDLVKVSMFCKFKVDEQRRIITGALMIADLPIYRSSEKMGEFYVVFDSNQIEKIVQKFFKQGNTANVNMMHDATKQVDGVYMFESFIIDSRRGIKAPEGFTGITEGSWIGSYKIDNDEVWTSVMNGTFKGYSVEGMFDMEIQKKSEEQEIIDLIDEIAQL